MSCLEWLEFGWGAPPTLPTEDEIFAAWLAFGGDSTLDEFTPAYLSTLR